MEFIGEIMGHIIEIMLALGTFGLWYSTARMNHFEKVKMTEAMKAENDNMTGVALTIEHDRHIEKLRSIKRVSRRNKKGGVI